MIRWTHEYGPCPCDACMLRGTVRLHAARTGEAIVRFQIARELRLADYAALLDIANRDAVRSYQPWDRAPRMHRHLRDDLALVYMHHYGDHFYAAKLTMRGRAVLELMQGKAYAV